ncbi:MAG: hypothetical protein O3C65_14155 [Proteobacteria bacterium]|nr:hypothetical protein [Pseudomonadota bacterium]
MHFVSPNQRTLRRRALLGTTALFLIATGVSFPGQSAQADFGDGTIAYESGDYERAYNEWLPLARAGNAAAQRNIGQLYRLGLGVPQDLRVAANWYRLAADQGLSRAQANLGVMYLRGEGVERDAARAAEWFGKAAEQGHTIAQYNLALMLEQGYGVPRDTRQAARWFSEAAEGGHDKADDRLAAILSNSVTPAAGEVEPTGPKPATPIQTARAEDYLPTRFLNRGDAATALVAGVPTPTDPAPPVQVAAAPTTTDVAPRRPNRLTEALTARPSPANIAGTPAARFAVRPAAQAPAQVADLPESAPETPGLRRPAFLQAPSKAPRDDKPVQAALGAGTEPRRTSGPVTLTAPPQALIEVPVAPFLKAEAVAGAQPATSAASARPSNVTPAPFLKAEAGTQGQPPNPPSVPVAPVQVAAVVVPPVPPLVRREPAPIAFTVPAAPVVVPKAVPAFLQREAMAPPPGHDLIPRFGPNSYLAPRDIPVVLRLDAVPPVAGTVPAGERANTDAALVAPRRNDTPPPTEPREVPTFLVRESQLPKPADRSPPPVRETPTQLAALSETPRDPVFPDEATATSTIGARIPTYYLQRSAEASTPTFSGLVPPTEPSPQQVAALTLPRPAPAPVTVKAIPAFLQREAAAVEHDDTQEPVIVMTTPVASVPRFLRAEALAPNAPAKLAALSPKPAPIFLAKEAASEASAPAVPELLRREAAGFANSSLRNTPNPAPRPVAPLDVAEPVLAAVAPVASVPTAVKPTDIPVFLREEAATGALAMVDTPRAGDPVGRAKRVTTLLATAEEAAASRLPGAIPLYYRDRASLIAELELADDDVAPLPFLRRAPRQNTGAPIQPIPNLLVAEAQREAAPVQPFLRNEAASAVRNNAPGTGGQDRNATRLAALPDAAQSAPAAAPSRAVESAEDRRAVDTGVAAYLGRDYEKALAFWLPAAVRGNADAQFFVAGLYLDGNGLERDLIQSHIWFARSASQGHQRAAEQMNLLRKIMTQDQYAEAERRRTTE